jgi:hypothetical protein
MTEMSRNSICTVGMIRSPAKAKAPSTGSTVSMPPDRAQSR